jgi:hypothetical protein
LTEFLRPQIFSMALPSRRVFRAHSSGRASSGSMIGMPSRIG